MEFRRVEQAVRALRPRVGRLEVAVVAGTGLEAMAGGLEVAGELAYGEIPHFPVPSLHPGRLLWGRWSGRRVGLLLGRVHLYEGWSAGEVVRPLRTLQALGAGVAILTNAAGGLNPELRPGGLMLIRDQINLTGENPLVGEQREPRFPDMSRAYDPGLRELARRVAERRGLALREGVYVGLKGPSLETPAETRMLRLLGADAVGMSTVLEAIAAVHLGMRVLGISAITNLNLPEAMAPLSLEEVRRNAQRALPALLELVEGVLAEL